MAVAEREKTKQNGQVELEITENTALARRPGSAPMTPEEWQMIASQSAVIAAAGVVLPAWIKEAGPMAKYVVAAVISKGRELGLQPMYSLENVAMIKGKTMVSSQALLALIQSRHGRTAVTPVETTPEKATFRFRDPRHPDWQPPDITITLKQAKDRGWTVAGGKEQPTWKNMPEVMLRWRAIAEGARLYFADSISGIYLPGEIEGTPYKIENGNLEIDFDAIEGEVVRSEEVPTTTVRAESYEEFEARTKAAEPKPAPAQQAKAESNGNGKPTQAQWDTLEAVVRELLQLQGKNPETWKSSSTKAVRSGMALQKNVDQLSGEEMQQLIQIAATQRDFLANEAAVQEQEVPAPEEERELEAALPIQESF